MQSRNRLFDDAARVAGGALGTLSGIRREIDGLVRHQIDKMLSGMDLVTRDEFDTVKAMATRAREENEELEARLQSLEMASAKTANTSRRGSKSSLKASATKKS